MIRRERGELVVECTDCGETKYGGVLDFVEFWAESREEGRLAIKADGEWSHVCPDCVKESRESDA